MRTNRSLSCAVTVAALAGFGLIDLSGNLAMRLVAYLFAGDDVHLFPQSIFDDETLQVALRAFANLLGAFAAGYFAALLSPRARVKAAASAGGILTLVNGGQLLFPLVHYFYILAFITVIFSIPAALGGMLIRGKASNEA